MNFLLLGCGKTGALVGELARKRGHDVRVLRSQDNPNASALTPQNLREVDVVLDFTSPDAALKNMEACIQTGKNIVVGTTGWYEELPKIRARVEAAGTGFVFGANFSLGVNIFFEIARASAAALKHGYFGQIFERHHAQKKDAPSGTALSLQHIVRETSDVELEIVSFREGEVVGMHEITFDSPHDDIYICHDSKSRRGFAEGAVRAAEWVAGKKGFYDFRDIWQQL